MKKIAVETLNTQLFNCQEYNVNLATREIFLHPFWDTDDTDNAEVDYRMAVKFEKNLRILDEQSDLPILIHQHTVGGSWDDGMAIYDAIKASRSYITILAYAHARSMSSIFFQAADRRVMLPNAYFLIHQGKATNDDRVRPYLVHAEQLKREREQMLRIYAERMKISRNSRPMSVKEKMSYIDDKLKEYTDWILTAEEAVKYGLADGVLGQKKFKTIEGLLK